LEIKEFSVRLKDKLCLFMDIAVLRVTINLICF
jgi:hypothetical protein